MVARFKTFRAIYRGPYLLSSTDNILETTFYDREKRHHRFLDSIHEQSLDSLRSDEFQDVYGLSVDAVIREVPFYGERELPDTDVLLPVNRRRTCIEAGDVDLGIIDLENQLIGVYEVKPEVAEKKSAEKQLEDFADRIETVNDAYGTDWSVTGKVINDAHLRQQYLDPGWYDAGIYGTKDSLREVFTDQDFVVLEKEVFPELKEQEVFTEW